MENIKEALAQLPADGLVKALLGYEIRGDAKNTGIVDFLVSEFTGKIAVIDTDDPDYMNCVDLLETYINDQDYRIRSYGARFAAILLEASSINETNHIWDGDIHNGLVASCQHWAYMSLPPVQDQGLRYWTSKTIIEAEKLFWAFMVKLTFTGEDIREYKRIDFREETLLENVRLGGDKVLVRGDAVDLAERYFTESMQIINAHRETIENDLGYQLK
ncbi:hypothetical protein A3K72_03170 [Candidatus Woesearchaeota archaeon RBG_13_36_6]|nr:MAG: hypothetical protein A3K72_03170 [Candidatus Woesearchaeota archaeon RBG_13_36_6]